jgi:CYTH domain-containing protein
MGTEIERKFLLIGDDWRTLGKGKPYCQGYLSSGEGITVRVRTAGDQGFLTIKGPTCGLSRKEYEYQIPYSDAQEMLTSLCYQPLIEKIRYVIEFEGATWEVDEFKGMNEGLIVAEIELNSPCQKFVKPHWIGNEVSEDPRYRNANLVRNPYNTWVRK